MAKYEKEGNVSYTLGTTLTLELLNKFSKVEQFKISTQNQLHFYH